MIILGRLGCVLVTHHQFQLTVRSRQYEEIYRSRDAASGDRVRPWQCHLASGEAPRPRDASSLRADRGRRRPGGRRDTFGGRQRPSRIV